MSWHGEGKGLKRVLTHATGWKVRHCGHPTAHWSWYVQSPEGVSYVRASGSAWAHQDEAKAAAEELSGGGSANSWPMSQALRVRAEQKALPYGGAARKRMNPEKRAEQKRGLDRTNAERWRWVRMTHAETLEAMGGAA